MKLHPSHDPELFKRMEARAEAARFHIVPYPEFYAIYHHDWRDPRVLNVWDDIWEADKALTRLINGETS